MVIGDAVDRMIRNDGICCVPTPACSLTALRDLAGEEICRSYKNIVILKKEIAMMYKTAI